MQPVLRIFGLVLAFLAAAWLIALTASGMGSSFFGDWRLVFLRWNSAVSFWLLSMLSGGCVAAIAVLFRYEQQLIPRRLGFTLLGLRLLLILVLFLTLLEPVWTWSYDKTETGRVVLALDLSQSMETIDRQADQAEQLRWAEGIGMLGNPKFRERTAQWIQALANGKEPEWVGPNEADDDVSRARLARIRRDNLFSQLEEVQRFSRLELARRALVQGTQPVLDQLDERALLDIAAFGERSVLIEPDALHRPLDANALAIGKEHSNLLALTEAARTHTDPARLAGAVLVTDGHDTDSAQTSALLNRMQGLGVPVHTVLVGSEHRPRDLSIVHVDHPESVFLKDQPQIKAIVQTTGFQCEPVQLKLEGLNGDEGIVEEESVVADRASAEVDFTLDALSAGRHRFRLTVLSAENETRDDNNAREFSVNVVDDRARVLILEGEGRWEFRYLDAALTRDERVTVDHVLFEQPYLGILPKPFFPTRLEDVPREFGRGTSFAAYDVVIIGDVSPQHLTSQRWQELDRYVRDEGGTLVLTAGKRFFPLAYSDPLIAQLLPLTDLREVRLNNASAVAPPPERGFRLDITPEGEQLPPFQLAADPGNSRRIWRELPGHLWGIVGAARGGANVWATVNDPDLAVSLEEERKNALFAQQYVGAGQVVWIGLDSTWRWRYLVGDLYHHRFWGQLVRWAVSFKAAVANDIVRLGLRQSVISTGETAHVQVRWDSRFAAQHPDLDVQVMLERVGQGPAVTRRLDLAPVSGNPLLRYAEAPDLPAGEYTVRLDGKNGQLTEELPEVVLVVNQQVTPELQDVSANPELLKELAAATGGQFLQLNEIERLPELFKNVSHSETVREEIPLYGHWIVLVLFCCVATTEWVLRKLNGLP